MEVAQLIGLLEWPGEASRQSCLLNIRPTEPLQLLCQTPFPHAITGRMANGALMATGLLSAMTLMATSVGAASDGGTPEDAELRLGRTLSADFWAGRLDAVWTRMSPEMQKALGGNVSGLAGAREQILAIAGGAGETVSERLQPVAGNVVFLRTFRGTRGGEQLQEQWAIQGNRTVVGFYVRPPSMFLPDTAR